MRSFLIGTAAAILAGGAALAQAQQGQPEEGGTGHGAQQQAPGMGSGMMRGHRMGPGMMGGVRGMGGMGPHKGPHMMVMMMALVDTDESGTLSLEEVQAVHARMFRLADADDDGELTPEEIARFMHGRTLAPEE